MAKLLMLKGLPASGKSTYAKELAIQGWKRVNKDDLRLMVDNGKWSGKNEKTVLGLEFELAKLLLKSGHDVVVDDTNFAYEGSWRNIAGVCDVEFEVKFFDVPLMECIERDSKRGDKSVGAKVIQSMYDRYLKPEAPIVIRHKKNCYIFDIDGTIAQMDGRSPYDYSKVHTDKPKRNIINILRLLDENTNILIVSGRTDDCMDVTMKWLNDNDIPYNGIYMRKSGDSRKDSIIKKEIYEEHIKPYYNVEAVFDDRNQVVDMWRSLGLDCLQVYYGYF